MNTKLIASALVAGCTVLSAGIANAEETSQVKDTGQESTYPRKLAPVNHALELTIESGYAQGVGKVGDGVASLTNTGNAGGSIELGVGYRVIPNLTLGVYGTGSMFSRGDNVDNSANLYSSTAGFQAGWHFLPNRELDPWISVGSGWRGYFNNTNLGTSSMHGLEIARLQVGADFRVAEAVAISPVIGADMSIFLTQEQAGQSSWRNIQNPNVNTFVFAGLAGRFDIPTDSQQSSTVAAR